MCLIIDSKKVQKSTRLEGFKFVRKIGDKYFAPYRNNEIPIGDYISDRTSAEISQAELWDCAVHKGIHVYTELDDADDMCNFSECLGASYVVLRCAVEPEDHVADARFQKEAVYTKVKVIGEV